MLAPVEVAATLYITCTSHAAGDFGQVALLQYTMRVSASSRCTVSSSKHTVPACFRAPLSTCHHTCTHTVRGAAGAARYSTAQRAKPGLLPSHSRSLRVCVRAVALEGNLKDDRIPVTVTSPGLSYCSGVASLCHLRIALDGLLARSRCSLTLVACHSWVPRAAAFISRCT